MAYPKVIDPVLTREFAFFSRQLKLYAARVEGDVGAAVRQQARLFGVDLATKTNPFGKSKKARLKGEGSVGMDISRVFASHGTIHQEIERQSAEAADAFYFLIKAGKIHEAQELVNKMGGRFAGIRIEGVSESAHQSERSFGGRVRRPRPAYVAAHSRDLENYREEIKNRVFWAKASWTVGLHRIGGTRGLPAYITRHKQAPGHIEDLTRANRPKRQVNFVSRVPYVRSLISYSSVKRALAYRGRSMMMDMQRAARHNFKKRI